MYIFFSFFHFVQLYLFPLTNALVYVDIDQQGNKLGCTKWKISSTINLLFLKSEKLKQLTCFNLSKLWILFLIFILHISRFLFSNFQLFHEFFFPRMGGMINLLLPNKFEAKSTFTTLPMACLSNSSLSNARSGASSRTLLWNAWPKWVEHLT